MHILNRAPFYLLEQYPLIQIIKELLYIWRVMKLKIAFAVLSVISCIAVRAGHFRQSFDRAGFYGVMKSGDSDAINNELTILESASIPEKEAYEGALLMKKAGLVTKAKDKLKFFKPGRIKLETALMNDGDNGEYHFLRLTVQEHAPKAAKYSKELEKDRDYVLKSFKNLLPVVQQAIADYSKTSKVLHQEDFNLQQNE